MHFRATITFNRSFSLAILVILTGFVFLNGYNSNANLSLVDDSDPFVPTNIDSNNRIVTIEGNGDSINIGSIQLLSLPIGLRNIVIHQAPGTIIEGQALVGVNITLIDSPDSIIRDNTITGITGSIVYGIYISNSSNTIVQNNTISEISSTSETYGIYIKDSSNVVIENNELFLLSADTLTYGIFSTGSGSVMISGNSLHELSSGNFVHGIDLRLNGGLDNIHSNILTDFSGESLSGIITIGTNQEFIEMNTISGFTTTATGREVVGIAVFGNEFTALNNLIQNLETMGADKEFGYGILGNSESFTAINNTISGISASTTTDYVHTIGMYFLSASNPDNLVANNIIDDITGDGITDANVIGLYFDQSSNFNVEFNKISNLSASSPNTMFEAEIMLMESNLGNFNFVEGASYPITWSHDNLPNHNQYYLYQDNINVDSNIWSDGSTLDSTKVAINTDLPVGTYQNTILVLDTITGMTPVTDTITVNIIPVFSPQFVDRIVPPGELGSVNNFVIWEFIDNNPSNYTLFVNGVSLTNSTWESGTPILYNIDHLSGGEYNFSIRVFDEDGNSSNDTIIVIIEDRLFPEVEYILDPKVEQELTASNITWFLADFNPDYFKLFANGSEVLNGTWQSQTPIIFSLYDWDLGLTNFTMEAQDLFGHITIVTTYVLVIDSLEPLLNEPFDIFLDEGDLGVTLEWIAEDFNSGNWTLFENDFNYQNGTWENEVPIVIVLDDYKVGRYNFTIFVQDAFNNTVADTVIVNIFVPTDSTYTKNTSTRTTTDQNIFQDIDPVYIAVGGGVLGVATIGSILRRRRGF